jgi:hypothetical protein
MRHKTFLHSYRYLYASEPDQDDLNIIARKVPWVQDDVGGVPSSAYRLSNSSNAGGQSFVGIISNSSDVDVFRFLSDAGDITVTLLLASATTDLRRTKDVWERTNLNASVVISKADGTLVRRLAASDGLFRGTVAGVTLPTAVSLLCTRAGHSVLGCHELGALDLQASPESSHVLLGGKG